MKLPWPFGPSKLQRDLRAISAMPVDVDVIYKGTTEPLHRPQPPKPEEAVVFDLLLGIPRVVHKDDDRTKSNPYLLGLPDDWND